MAEPAPEVQQAVRRIEDGRREHLLRRRKYDLAYDIYRASEPRALGVEPWQSKLRVKYGMQVINTALVNMVSGQPRVVVRPRHPESELPARAMQILMDYYIGEDHFVEKQPVFVQQALITGVTVAKNHWVYETRDVPKRGDQNGVLPAPGSATVPTVVRDGPTFEPWDIYRCYWTPGARSADDAEYIVLQTFLSKDQLLRNACTIDHSKKKNQGVPCNGIYHNVQQLLDSGAHSQQPQQTAQQRFLQGELTRYRNRYLVEEIWRDDRLTVIGNDQVLLRDQPNPYWHGKKPIVIAQTMPDLFELIGIPDTELVDHLQQAMGTLQNMTIDNLHLTVMRGITYREGGVTDPNMLQLRPRFKWPVSDHDDIRPFETAPISSDVFTERERLLQDMQLVTGVNPYVSGSDLSTVDQNTATGVTALQEVASRLLRFKAAQVHYKGYQRSFEMWGDMIQQFMSDPVNLKIEGPGNISDWVRIGPQDVAGHYQYILEGSEESLSRQQERGEAIALLNAFAPLAPLGIINFKPILEKVAAAYDFPNPESLLNQPPPPAAPQADMQQLQYNVRGPQLGAIPPYRQNERPGDTILDPRLASALALLPQR